MWIEAGVATENEVMRYANVNGLVAATVPGVLGAELGVLLDDVLTLIE